MRIAIITESFLPHMNGVTRSVLEIVTHAERRGHHVLIIAPAATGTPDAVGGAAVRQVPSVPLPGYPSVKVAVTTVARVSAELRSFAPDVVHLASPFALGWQGVIAAERLGIPVIAAYQTDVAAYAERYHVAATTLAAEAHIARLHRRATLTLVPSSAARRRLVEIGVDRLRPWGRGVDTGQFDPRHRDDAWRAAVGDGVIIGYVGRLAPEKQIADLAAVADLPGTHLVIVGDGPELHRLRQALPTARFLGHLEGVELARALASFDVFVHPGESETFGQTLQEAHASGVPVVAPGSGGPLDLVRSSVDGWLYRPGDGADLRSRVLDLVGDERKRAAFGAAGRAAVAARTWQSVIDDLLGHAAEAQTLHAVDAARRTRRMLRPEPPTATTTGRVRSFVALGDSLTEGLCDPAPDGTLRGWADRLATLLAQPSGMHYANLAVRSRRVQDVVTEQVPAALALRPDLVAILIGANDLTALHVDVAALAAELEGAVRRLRAAGSGVLLVTPFLPDHPATRPLRSRFGRFAEALAGIAARTGAVVIDTDLIPELGRRPNWGDDLVHLSAHGHRLLAYRAAAALGIADADALSGLDAMFHAEGTRLSRGQWWVRHALPWAWRRIRGKRAGDGLSAKHSGYVLLGPARSARAEA